MTGVQTCALPIYKVPLHSTIWTRKSDGSLDWTFEVVGSFSVKDPTQASTQSLTLLFHYELFDEGRSFGNGNVSWFEERVSDPSQAFAISNRIDALFANSPNETKTQPANDFQMAFIKQGLQGLELSPRAFVPGIGAAVLLALIVGLPPALRAMRLNIVDALADKR